MMRPINRRSEQLNRGSLRNPFLSSTNKSKLRHCRGCTLLNSFQTPRKLSQTHSSRLEAGSNGRAGVTRLRPTARSRRAFALRREVASRLLLMSRRAAPRPRCGNAALDRNKGICEPARGCRHLYMVAPPCGLLLPHDQSVTCVRNRFTFDCARRRNSWRFPCGKHLLPAPPC